jgi:hypothetical protein
MARVLRGLGNASRSEEREVAEQREKEILEIDAN